MSRVRVLPQELVNQIAAGEVIERPASVVKELVENALDAGASHVRIEIEEGGRKLVQVSDDGSGMTAEDLALAFRPHATSKLDSAEDLFRIATFGFRGEALASLGAVARVRLVSRPQGSGEGAELTVDCGRLGEVRPAAAREGSSVTVHNLFQNLPARRKFLRAPQVESEHIHDTLTRFALAHPHVRFDFYQDGELRLTLPPADIPARIGRFFGEELQGAILEARGEESPVPYTAYLAPARHSRTTAKALYLFLNGRPIRDRVLSHAVQEAYRELLPHGRYPVVFLFLEAEPGEADVNVHPTKNEVRFRSVWRVHDRIAEGLRRRLMETELVPQLTGSEIERRFEGGAAPTAPPLSRQLVDFFSGSAPAAVGTPPLLTTGRRFFQVHDRYLVEEAEDGIRIIDQHALHERYLLNRFRKEYAAGDIARQRLLLPQPLRVSTAERGLLERHRSLVESLGIDFDDFGPDTIAVRAVPALLAEEDAAVLVRDLAERLGEHGESERAVGEPLPLLEEALEFLACRSAVKFGRRLAPEEQEKLLAAQAEEDFSATCAHGRPTAVKFTLEDLDRLFKRK